MAILWQHVGFMYLWPFGWCYFLHVLCYCARRCWILFPLSTRGIAMAHFLWCPCCSQAIEKANQQIVNAIGKPIVRGPWYSASIAVNHVKHSVSCTFPVSGPKEMVFSSSRLCAWEVRAANFFTNLFLMSELIGLASMLTFFWWHVYTCNKIFFRICLSVFVLHCRNASKKLNQ